MRPAVWATDRLKLRGCAVIWLRGRAPTNATTANNPNTVGAATANGEDCVGDRKAVSKSNTDWENAVEGLKNSVARGLAGACVKTTSAVRQQEDRAEA